jgi:type III secretion protein J
VLGTLFASGCDVTLARGLEQAEADRMTAELNQRGIATSKSLDAQTSARYQIEVSGDAVEAAVDTLTATAHSPLGSLHDETSSEDTPLIPTPSAQQQRASRALALELAHSIELVPGLLRARVHLNQPSAQTTLVALLTPLPASTPSAAVLLLRAASATAVSAAVRQLVVGAVPGITPQAVSIVETVRPDPVTRCAPLARIGPVGVTQASARTLKLWLGVALAINMLVASALLFVLTRKRRTSPS